MDKASARTLVRIGTRRAVTPSNARGGVLGVSRLEPGYRASGRVWARLTGSRATARKYHGQRFARVRGVGAVCHAVTGSRVTGSRAKKIPRTPSRGQCARYRARRYGLREGIPRLAVYLVSLVKRAEVKRGACACGVRRLGVFLLGCFWVVRFGQAVILADTRETVQVIV